MNKEKYNPIKVFFLFIQFAFSFPWLNAQVDCNTTSGGLFGRASEDIHGSSLALDPEKQGFYLGGMKNDSAMIIRFDNKGDIQWTRTIDIVPNRRDNISSILVDSDKMIVIAGTVGQVGATDGGSVYILRYDPLLDQVIWAHEFIPGVSRNFCWSVIELSPGGNFLMSNNPVDDVLSNVDAELLEISRSTGMPVNGKGKRIHLGGSEDITNLVLYNGALYGTGRFTDGLTNADMRSAVIKMDINDRDIQWAKLGHVSSGQTARLYGVDLTVYNDFIYSSVLGDPSGTSTTNTKFYIQKLQPDGTLVWLKQYNLPGSNDWAYEMVPVNSGIVIFAAQKANPIQFILIEIDAEGDITWARSFPTNMPINTGSPLIGDGQLIASQEYLVFTGYTQDHFMVVMTDLEGYPFSPCIAYEDISINVVDVSNPVLYQVQPEVSIPSFTIRSYTSSASQSSLWVDPDCIQPDILEFYIDSSVCAGEKVEGYGETGIYLDTFVSSQGCDSIRILDLKVMHYIQSELNVRICPGENYEGYTASGVFQDTFAMTGNCDSIRNLFIVYDTLYSFIQTTGCSGESVEGYVLAGVYQDTFVSSRGCDSIRTLDLQFAEYITNEISQIICQGMTYEGYSVPGIYQDTFELPGGCDSIRILEVKSGSFYIPNVFSPNGDGVNDYFEVTQGKSSNLELTYFAIFDRFGNMAYETTEWPVFWKGDNNGREPYNPGVFAYIMRYLCGSDLVYQHGTITLIR